MIAPATRGGEFDRALLGDPCWLELVTGECVTLPVHRWRRPPAAGDELLLARCTGPTLDVGCGPGRLAGALGERGVLALGIDTSATAVALARRRGGVAMRRDVFGPLPAEGRWQHVLLADGNIGIGGDPAGLLRRTAELLGEDGSALVELEPPGGGLRHANVRLGGRAAARGDWFSWAWLGADAIAAVARRAGLRVGWAAAHGERWFAELRRPR
ncbi:class I SAM-dependent methyltransferase [Amycolatopsis cihanbeyliensis]|uniref:Methyltransferase family protein n=1 Tax=Amycolatopsis cihanbeyliensis TaxID=1128664 RepID=A0A542DI20_AMYCI|nr:class I SAM-dependent methyltransferase [Amycolatopsis cihanbeyliensis]TQJ02738.1 methyltransferase family protein [Amycolatopsis cihanbeyliensis]